MRRPAVVIGGGMTGLGVMRNLGRSGIQVCCAIEEKDPAVYSCYCKRAIIFPGVESSSQKLGYLLNRLEAEFDGKVAVFPTSDLSVLNASLLADSRPGYFVSIPDRSVVETLVMKRKFYRSLQEKGVAHPKTILLDAPGASGYIGDEVQFPVFVKPSVSQSFGRKFRRKGFVAHSRKELNQCLSLVNKLKIDVMVQEILPGPPTNHFLIDGYIDRDFEPKAVFARRRIRQFPPQFGNSVVCESIPLAQVEDTKETLLKYLVSIGYHGIFNAEFKKDSRDDKNKLLEVNARSWWYNTFPSTCGLNIILMAYLDEIGEKVRSTTKYETGRKLIYFTQDLKLALTTARQKNFSLQKWISPLLDKKDWAFFANDDPAPFLMNALKEVRSTMKKETIGRFLHFSEE